MTSNFAVKLTSSDLNESWYDVRGRRDIHDNITFKVIRGQGQGEEMTSVPCRDYFIHDVNRWMLGSTNQTCWIHATYCTTGL